MFLGPIRPERRNQIVRNHSIPRLQSRQVHKCTRRRKRGRRLRCRCRDIDQSVDLAGIDPEDIFAIGTGRHLADTHPGFEKMGHDGRPSGFIIYRPDVSTVIPSNQLPIERAQLTSVIKYASRRGSSSRTVGVGISKDGICFYSEIDRNSAIATRALRDSGFIFLQHIRLTIGPAVVATLRTLLHHIEFFEVASLVR